MIRYEVTSAPGTDAVTLVEAKAHLKVDTTDDDTLITSLITAAQKWVEGYCNVKLITQTIKEYWDGFPTGAICPVSFTVAPVQSITSITYTDTNGVTQTWSSALYQSDLKSKPARFMPVDGGNWPEVKDYTLNAIAATYVVGFGAAAAVPENYKIAIKLALTDMYEGRDGGADKMSVRTLERVRQYLMASDGRIMQFV